MALSKVGSNQLDSTATPTFAELDVDNVKVNGNTISSTSGDITLDPDGTGDTNVDNGDFLFLEEAASSPYPEQKIKWSNDSTTANGFYVSQDTSRNGRVWHEQGVDLVFGTTNTERMRIDSSGKIGIGTSTPTNTSGLEIQTSSTTAGLWVQTGGTSSSHIISDFRNGANVDVLKIRGDASSIFQGNVGIGTSPSVALHVKAGSGQIRLHEGSAADNKYGEIEVSNGKLILHSDKANVENSSTMQFHLDNIEYARFIDNGTFLIGTTNGTGDGGGIQLHGNLENGGFINVKKTSSGASGNKFVQFSRDGSEKGSIALNGTNAVQYNTSSDYRLKRDVVDMTDAIDRVKTLLPRRFSWISDPDTTVDGFLAHEAQTVVPEAVSGTHNEVDADGNAVMQGIDQAKLVPLLTASLKESIAKIEALEARVTALEAG